MSNDEEHDGLDEYKDPEVLKLIVRGEREDHKKELAALREDFDTRLAALQKKVSRGETPRPSVIHPLDVKEILRNGKPNADIIHKKLRDGSLKVSEDAPRGIWKKPVEKIGVVQLLRLSLADYETTMKRVRKGEVEIVSE